MIDDTGVHQHARFCMLVEPRRNLTKIAMKKGSEMYEYCGIMLGHIEKHTGG